MYLNKRDVLPFPGNSVASLGIEKDRNVCPWDSVGRLLGHKSGGAKPELCPQCKVMQFWPESQWDSGSDPFLLPGTSTQILRAYGPPSEKLVCRQKGEVRHQPESKSRFTLQGRHTFWLLCGTKSLALIKSSSLCTLSLPCCNPSLWS